MAIDFVFCNYTVCAEIIIEWITECISYMYKLGLKTHRRFAAG
jgi:hypothetical protein